MKLVLSDNGLHKRFAPLTLTRPVGDLRIGILTNTERWKKLSNATIFYETETYLQGKFPATEQADVVVNGAVIPTKELAQVILSLPTNSVLKYKDVELARKGNGEEAVQWLGDVPIILSQRWHLYQYNDRALEQDFELLTAGKMSQSLSKSNTIIGDASQIFLEEGAVVEASILNTKSGPIYVGKDAEIMEGCIVRGGLAMGEHSALKMGAKVYGAVTLGPHCKVGGEVNNVIFQAYSNKGHDGFLGNALIGEWCNLGADTNTSNLKNNYGNVSTYSYETKSEVKTDMQFMGVCMGDHSKCGINTMFNTATVVGVSCNIFGGDFPQKFIPSFSWGGQSFVPFKFEKAVEYANNMMRRRGLQLTDAEISILKFLNEE
ncbi:MAG: glucose-1-phosphate thymidylyltransferase [Crocinitomicaceae bacterium]|nr:glucose-1-phosphate thymidylyltransferase [Crocinitomicaceae bacterium]